MATLTYDGTTYNIEGKPSVAKSRDGKVVRISCRVTVTGGAGTVDTALDALAANYKDVDLTIGGTTFVSITHGTDWIVRSEAERTADRLSAGPSGIIRVTITAMRSGAILKYDGTTYYLREGHTLTVSRAEGRAEFDGVIVAESATAYATAVGALSANYKAFAVADVTDSTTFLDATGADWLVLSEVTKFGDDQDLSYQLRVRITARMGGAKFSYGAAGPYVIDDPPRLTVNDKAGKIMFSAIVEGFSAGDAQTAIAALAKSEQDFSLTDRDGNTIYSITAASRSGGMSTEGSAELLPGGQDQDQTFRVAFRMVAEREISDTSRAGRREGSIEIQRGADGLRVVTLRGTYTGRTSGGAKATYDAQVATWVTAVLASIDGTATWQDVGEPQIRWDDRDHLLSFVVTRQEVWYWATPGETTNGIHRSMTIRRIDPQSFGRFQLAQITVGGRNSRYQIVATTDYDGDASGTTLATYYTATIRPWIEASIAAARVGQGTPVWSAPIITLEGVNRRRIRVEVEVADQQVYRLAREVVVTQEASGFQFENVWDGLDYTHDIRRTKRMRMIVQTVTLERVGAEPETPAYLQRPYWFIDESVQTETETLDPVLKAQILYRTTWTRRYRYAIASEGVALDPLPLGAPPA